MQACIEKLGPKAKACRLLNSKEILELVLAKYVDAEGIVVGLFCSFGARGRADIMCLTTMFIQLQQEDRV